ncbi:MAG: glycosyltransferase [Rhodobacteraceae bacterium]|nr:glycosyltransferase [Paracoccaceae bacterium]
MVIVDASDDWETTRQTLQAECAELWQQVALIHVPANVRSLTYQRNQALGLASGDIVFSLDDDIYLYPDTAAIIMRAYEADRDTEIAVIGAHFVERAPDGPKHSTNGETPRRVSLPKRLLGGIKSGLESQLSLDHHFVPYDAPVDTSPLPQSVEGLGLLPGGLVNGGRTTFRRRFGEQMRWSELLRYYATHEDSDFSYRMLQLGRLVVAPDARLFHADGNERPFKRFKVNTIRARNLMALHRVSSRNRWLSCFRLLKSFLYFAGLYALIDPAQGRYSLPTVRAYLFSILQIPLFLFAPISDFRGWYIGLQEKMYQG